MRGLAHSKQFGLIATAGADRHVRVWQEDNAIKLAELIGHKAPVTAVVTNDAAQHIASCDAQRSIRIWHIRTFECLQTVVDKNVHPPENAFTALLLDDTGGRLVAAGSYLSVWACDTPATKAAEAAKAPPVDLAGLHDSKIICSLFSAKFQQVTTIDSSGGVVVHDYDQSTSRLIRTCRFSVEMGHGEMANITAAVLDSNGSRLVTAATNGSIRLWNVNSGEQMPLPLPLPSGAPGAPVPGSLEAAEGTGLTLKPKQPVATSDDLRFMKPVKPVEVTGLAWIPGSTSASVHHIAVTGWAGAVSLWGDPAIWRYGTPTQVALPSPSARLAAASGAQPGRATDVLSLVCCPKEFIAVGTADGRVLLYYFRTPDLRLSSTPKTEIKMPGPPGGTSPVERLLWLPQRHGLLIIGERGRCHLLKVHTGVLETDVAALGNGLTAVALSENSDPTLLVAANSSGEVALYDPSTVAIVADSAEDAGFEGQTKTSGFEKTGSWDGIGVEICSVVFCSADHGRTNWFVCGRCDGRAVLLALMPSDWANNGQGDGGRLRYIGELGGFQGSIAIENEDEWQDDPAIAAARAAAEQAALQAVAAAEGLAAEAELAVEMARRKSFFEPGPSSEEALAAAIVHATEMAGAAEQARRDYECRNSPESAVEPQPDPE
eukprot:SAG31_NODE_1457_length_8260_cov_2.805416_1_plen_660_part_00